MLSSRPQGWTTGHKLTTPEWEQNGIGAALHFHIGEWHEFTLSPSCPSLTPSLLSFLPSISPSLPPPPVLSLLSSLLFSASGLGLKKIKTYCSPNVQLYRIKAFCLLSIMFGVGKRGGWGYLFQRTVASILLNTKGIASFFTVLDFQWWTQKTFQWHLAMLWSRPQHERHNPPLQSYGT